MTISKQRIEQLFSGISGKRIAVIGDVMIDRYIWGNVSRISPEAPVPVVEVESESTRLGGAANVAHNIASLGAQTLLIGVAGDDASGREMIKILAEQHAASTGIIIDPTRPTTVKTRVIAHSQHVVRIDSEEKKDVDISIQKKIVAVLQNSIDAIDGIIIEDYNKGVIVKDLIYAAIDLARKHNKVITVDPKFNNFFEYKNVSVFKPNIKETEEALGKKLRTEEDVLAAGRSLLEKLNVENVLVTRSEKGMNLFEKNGSVTHIPTRARDVADVSGAGDTVIATLTAMLTAGASVREAAILAKMAGGIVVGEVGIVPIRPEQLLAETESM
ncbi:MAG: D-glycero-beta-D-manno-heptose-7-phosphate kinase [Ignavibacteriales bacterium]|nr:D-glycero-beta-D-manno-heptose-7-phosphate kinase [Ignavibacteriales bacterium]